MRNELLRIDYLSKRLGDDEALEYCMLSVNRGENHGMIGLNASGKTPLLRIIAGLSQPDRGRMYLDEKRYQPTGQRAAELAGVFYISAALNLQGAWSTLDNITMMSAAPRQFYVRKRIMNARAREVLRIVHMEHEASRKVYTLGRMDCCKISFAKALYQGAKLILFDCPIETFNATQIRELESLLRSLNAYGVSTILVDCDATPLASMCHSFSVMRNGRIVARFHKEELPGINLTNLLVGHKARALPPNAPVTKGLGAAYAFQDIRGAMLQSFSLRVACGEIVALVDLTGDANERFAQLISGQHPILSGRLSFQDKPIRIRSPMQAQKNGIAYMPDSAPSALLFPNMNLRQNLTIAMVKKNAAFGVIRKKELLAVEASMLEQLDSFYSGYVEETDGQPSHGESDITYLKHVLLMRLVAAKPRLLVLNNLMRGVDVLGKNHLNRVLQTIAADHIGLLYVTSMVEDALAIADRILLCCRTGIIVEIPVNTDYRERFNSDEVKAMLALYK